MTWSLWLEALAPEWALAVGACLVLLLGVTPARDLVRPLSLLSILIGLAFTIFQGTATADVSLPGLELSPLTQFVRLIGLSIGALIMLVNWYQADAGERGEYYSMILFSLLGLLLTPSSNDLIMLFFALELVSVPTYILVALSRTRRESSEAAVKYFFLGAMAAAIMAYGFSFLYGAAGTTTLFAPEGTPSIAASILAAEGLNDWSMIGLLLAISGMLFKIAAVPFQVYAPDVYQGAAASVTGMLGFVPKLAGFAALVKLLSLTNWILPDAVMWLLWVVAAATMIYGNVLALMQQNVKRMLAYSSIAHSGYMLIGLLVGPLAGAGPFQNGISAMLFYMAVYGAMNLGAFAVLAMMTNNHEEIETLDDLKGLSRRFPFAAFGMAVCAFSLMGFPPTAGFLGKVYIFSSAFSLEEGTRFAGPIFALAIIGVINSAVGAAYYLRIAGTCYLSEPTEPVESPGRAGVGWGLALCSLAMIVLFILPDSLGDQAARATNGMAERSIPAEEQLANR
jgi:NADH-quinone oxidoreductase subunit N